MFTRFNRVPLMLAMAAMVPLSACNGEYNVDMDDGKTLEALGPVDASISKLVLAGPDDVVMLVGDKPSITVAGDADAIKSLRFKVEGDTLSVARTGKVKWSDDKKATVTITMPALNNFVLAGSGKADLASLTGDAKDGGKAEIVLAGSGSATVAGIDAAQFDLTIAGSGDADLAGKAAKADMTIAGSGVVRGAGFKVDAAEVSVAGSGSLDFESDGAVEISVLGSGSVNVRGAATCTVDKSGSGSVNCGK